MKDSGEVTTLGGLETTDVLAAGQDLMRVVDQSSFDQAMTFIRDVVRPMQDAIAEHWGPHKKAAYDAWKALVADEKKDLEPLSKLEGRLKGLCAAWMKSRRKAAELYEADTGLAAPRPTTPGGVATRMKWKWRVEDADRIPRQYLIPDKEAIDKKVLKMGKTAEDIIPGIEVYEDVILGVSRGTP